MAIKTAACEIDAASTDPEGTDAIELHLAREEGFVPSVTFQSKGDNGSGANSVGRIFLNTTRPATLAGYNFLLAEVQLVATTKGQLTALASVSKTIDLPLEKGQRILVSASQNVTDGYDVHMPVGKDRSDFYQA